MIHLNDKQKMRRFIVEMLLFFIAFSVVWLYVREWLTIPTLYIVQWINLYYFDIIKKMEIVLNPETGRITGDLKIWASTVGLNPVYGEKYNASREVIVRIMPYTYGYISLCALFFASRRLKGWWWRLILGALILIPSQILGGFFRSYFELVQAYTNPKTGEVMIGGYLGLTTFLWSVVIYFYQATYLLLPPLMPILVWFLLCKKQLEEHFSFLKRLKKR